MILRLASLDGETLDPFDPRTFPRLRDDDPCHLSLSDRIDCTALLDRIDYEWAKALPWCHTYGSGSMSDETWTIDRPDHIYARRSVPMPGRITPSGRQAYGNLFLHRVVLTRAVGPPPEPRMVGDHINGDTLDCRRSNLRWATKVMNARNVTMDQGNVLVSYDGRGIKFAINCAASCSAMSRACQGVTITRGS